MVPVTAIFFPPEALCGESFPLSFPFSSPQRSSPGVRGNRTSGSGKRKYTQDRDPSYGGENYIILANGDIKFVGINIGKPESVAIGKYKVDCAMDPIQIDITWENGKSENGIIRFIGEEKKRMEIELSTPGSNERPIGFGGYTMLLTKKVKK
jgi:hypothetical protein